VSRASVADAKLKDPADASLTIWWQGRTTEVSMSVVHNTKRRANDICDGAPKGRGRCAGITRSRFVLALVAWTICTGTPSIGFPRPPVGAVDPAKVICHEPSVSRASVADAKLKDPADASLTIWWHQFYQA
jgi:hypothetical protein